MGKVTLATFPNSIRKPRNYYVFPLQILCFGLDLRKRHATIQSDNLFKAQIVTFWDKITKMWKFWFSGLRNVQKTTTKMNVSAHGDENAVFHFFARIIDIAKEKQW